MDRNDNRQLELELTVLGELIMFFDDLKAKAAGISLDDFVFDRCRALFIAMRKYIDSGAVAMDFISVQNFSGTDVKSVIAEALKYPSTSLHFDNHVTVLKEMSFERRVKQELTRLAASEEKIRIESVLELYEREKDNAHAQTWVDKARKKLSDYVGDIGKPLENVLTGFKKLDEATGGLQIPSVFIIGAYPSVGKTTFALNIATNQKCCPVVYFSLEMSVRMLYDRIISSMERIDYAAFRKRRFTSGQETLIRGAALKCFDIPLFIFDDVYDVETQSVIVSGIKPRLVIVDYIQKVRTAKKASDRRNEMDYISGAYKQIANFNQCVVMVLSQINRADRGQPTMASLKESGGLEADGDYIGLLHRPFVLDKNNPNLTEEATTLLLDKNKFGETGLINMHFDLKYQTFYESDNITPVPLQPPQRQKANRSKPEQVSFEYDNYYGENPFEQ